MRIFRLKDGKETRRGQLGRNSCLVLLAVGSGSFDSPLGPLPSPRAACNQGPTRTGRATACVKLCQHNTEAFLACLFFFFLPMPALQRCCKIHQFFTDPHAPPTANYVSTSNHPALPHFLSFDAFPAADLNTKPACFQYTAGNYPSTLGWGIVIKISDSRLTTRHQTPRACVLLG